MNELIDAGSLISSLRILGQLAIWHNISSALNRALFLCETSKHIFESTKDNIFKTQSHFVTIPDII